MVLRRPPEGRQGDRRLVLQIGERIGLEPLDSDDLGTGGRHQRLVVHRAGPEHHIDPAYSGFDHDPGLAQQLDVDADLLAHLSSGGVTSILATGQQATRKTPPVPVPVLDERDAAVGPFDDADGPDRVGRREGAHDPPPDTTGKPSEHPEQKPMHRSDHLMSLRLGPTHLIGIRSSEPAAGRDHLVEQLARAGGHRSPAGVVGEHHE